MPPVFENMPIFVHLEYTRLHSTLKMLMFYDEEGIILTILIIGNDMNTLICSEVQKNLGFLPKNSYKTDKKQK